ncbi:precorrin-6Y C5,15-methyltransferase (decarboxylating) subunit CbiT [Clostridium sp. 'deep sea']|uniref:precorrin-6Y C5,15-methyltransferase (decarboxylating) subunit CbiT n=1 Tax=Clostridium sp. 'deep sea' TaxID=2779445 RepID=UPI00189647D1|nr:precorrin-6Y C5,15-methyltransferase (decarboxylating) subunit CbiT [Clostridium sp. 'deep sea']QOR36733.1 precorrin-6Y C5,15-methyltransferase (decarboxylating) subunit CbiT [Clostridium sp. 'deep sea']
MSKYGLKDDLFIRGEVPMTKAEVRAITLSKLQLMPHNTVVDIGAGSGSVTVECALNCPKGMVYAIEKSEKALPIIKQNIAKFKLQNVEIIEGKAPVDLPIITNLTSAFIGGSGGQLDNIFSWLATNLIAQGIVVANCITLENAVKIINLLKQYQYKNIEIVQASIAKGKSLANLTMMIANNPVYIISAQK